MRTYWSVGATLLALIIASGHFVWREATARPLTPAMDESVVWGPSSANIAHVRLHDALHRATARRPLPLSRGFGASPGERPPTFDVFGRPGSDEPVPIPGGLFGGAYHLFLPGPTELGFGGLNVEPNVITDFQGFAAIAYMMGQALGSDGITYDMSNDMRVFHGNYVSDDGTLHRGTFVFT